MFLLLLYVLEIFLQHVHVFEHLDKNYYLGIRLYVYLCILTTISLSLSLSPAISQTLDTNEE